MSELSSEFPVQLLRCLLARSNGVRLAQEVSEMSLNTPCNDACAPHFPSSIVVNTFVAAGIGVEHLGVPSILGDCDCSQIGTPVVEAIMADVVDFQPLDTPTPTFSQSSVEQQLLATRLGKRPTGIAAWMHIPTPLQNPESVFFVNQSEPTRTILTDQRDLYVSHRGPYTSREAA